jgi:hypothetical protein
MGKLAVTIHAVSLVSQHLPGDDTNGASMVASVSCAGEKLKTTAIPDATLGWEDESFSFTLVDPGK